MKALHEMTREELLKQALELGDLPQFQHRPEMQTRRLLELLDNRELQNLVKEAVAEFKAAFQ